MNMFNESIDGGFRKAQKEATAVKILEAAKEIFEKEGYEKANIRKIAKKAGVAPGSVMHHFGDKQSLLHSALYDDLETVLENTLSKFGKGSLKNDLNALTKAVFQYYQKKPNLSRILLKESLFAEPPWSLKFAGQTGKVHQAIVQICEKAKRNGSVRKDIDCSIFAVSYLSFFYFNLIAWVQGAYETPVHLVNRLTEEYIKLIQ
ncbi:MAG: TetR/AcrR family transcriptional regulator [Spirochaetia bacterium]|nr:TetR/AcrR family transcriptional regulator [Spirochaetia bacterium]